MFGKIIKELNIIYKIAPEQSPRFFQEAIEPFHRQDLEYSGSTLYVAGFEVDGNATSKHTNRKNKTPPHEASSFPKNRCTLLVPLESVILYVPV